MINLNRPKYTRWLLQIGLAGIFLYVAVASLIQPANWTAFLPTIPGNVISPDVLIKPVAFYQLVLAVWLLSGKYLKLAGLLCALTLTGIVMVNLPSFIITFRDVGLIFMALALIFVSE